jgi:REP element-mobilizing transposase RayT
MTTGYQIIDQEGVYFLTFQVVNWIDLFTRKIYRDIIITNLRYCQQQKGLILFAFVIMSNHIHLLVRARNGNLSDVIRDLKGYSSKQIIEAIKNTPESRKDWILMHLAYAAGGHARNKFYQVWTHENHAEIVFSSSFFKQKLNYIHLNPVRAGIVEEPQEYIYSSAKNYNDEKGILDVNVIERGMLGVDRAY